jgi:hypothetical protein
VGGWGQWGPRAQLRGFAFRAQAGDKIGAMNRDARAFIMPGKRHYRSGISCTRFNCESSIMRAAILSIARNIEIEN